MELGEGDARGSEFNRAREAVCDAAWQYVANPDNPTWQRVDIALDMAQAAHDDRAIDFLIDISTGESELAAEDPLNNHDLVKLVEALVEYGDSDQVKRAVAVANSIPGSEVYGASLRGKAFIRIAEETEGTMQKYCLTKALQAAAVKGEAKDAGSAFTDPERAHVFLRAGTLTGRTELYQTAFDISRERTGHPRFVDFGTLAWQLAREIKILDGQEQPELRQALVATLLENYGKQQRPWDSPLRPLLPVLQGDERKQLLQNYTKRGKFMFDVAAYQVFVDTAEAEDWQGRWRQWRDERKLKGLQKDHQQYRHLDESHTNWELFQFGYNDDATLQRALRNIEEKGAANLGEEDRKDVRSRVAAGLASGLFSPTQRMVARGYLQDLRESAADERERFDSNLVLMHAEGDTESLAEATEHILAERPWEQTHHYSERHPDMGSHVDYRFGQYLRAVKAGEEKELLNTGVLLDR